MSDSTQLSLASVILPIWNGMADLPACFAALLQQTYAPLEIIAVDNASTDGSAAWIAAHYPTVRLIRTERNLGFGGACNAGMAAAKGDMLVLLNQDTQVHPDWLAGLVQALRDHPDVGIAGSKALYPDGTLQHAGGEIDAQGGGSHRGLHQPDSGQFDTPDDVEYVSGASLALRRTLYHQIGGFDLGFHPAYCEDVDLCLRTRAAGWRVRYTPQSVLIHNERSAAATRDAGGMLLYHRHRLRLVCKHWPLTRLQTEFLPAETAWLHTLGPGGERLIAAVHQAYLHQLLNLGELAAWRQTRLAAAPDEFGSEIEGVAQVLLTLRTVYPRTPIGQTAPTQLPQPPSLASAGALAGIRAQPFRSSIPLVGRLVAALRHAFNRIATESYVTPMFQQQSHFNSSVLQALHETQVALLATQEALRQNQAALAGDEHASQRTTTVLLEYLTGQAREIGALSQEVVALRQQLTHNHAPAVQGISSPEQDG